MPFENGLYSHRLTTKLGKLYLGQETIIFPNERGYYNGNETNPIFIKDLEKAKNRIENLIIKALK